MRLRQDLMAGQRQQEDDDGHPWDQRLARDDHDQVPRGKRPGLGRRIQGQLAGSGPSADMPPCSEQPEGAVVGAAHGLVVEGDTADTAVLGEDAGLRLDLLSGEDPADGGEQRVPVE